MQAEQMLPLRPHSNSEYFRGSGWRKSGKLCRYRSAACSAESSRHVPISHVGTAVAHKAKCLFHVQVHKDTSSKCWASRAAQKRLALFTSSLGPRAQGWYLGQNREDGSLLGQPAPAHRPPSQLICGSMEQGRVFSRNLGKRHGSRSHVRHKLLNKFPSCLFYIRVNQVILVTVTAN